MNREIRSDLYLAGITIVWGSTFIVIQAGIEFIHPLLLVFLRFAVASFCLLPVLLWRQRDGRHRSPFARNSGTLWKHGTLLGFLLFVSYATQTMGLVTTTVSKSAFITYTFAVFTPPLQFLLTGKRLRAGNLIGLALVFIGMFVFTRPEAGKLVQGDVLTFACALSFALYIVLLDRFGTRHDAAVLSFVQFLAVTFASGLSLLFARPAAIEFTPSLVLGVLYLALPATLLSLFVQTRYQPLVSPSRAAVIYALEPVFATALSFAVSGAVPRPYEYAGAALIFSGLLASELRIQRASRTQHLR